MNAVTLHALEAFPAQLEAHYAAIPPAFRHWAPPSWDGVPSEPLTALEQVCHVRDIEIEGYQVRFDRTLREADPVLASIDTEALARERAYGMANEDEALAAFREARARTVALLSGLTAAQLDRTAVFEGYGAVTMRGLVHYLCSHDQQHLAGLQWLLGKIESHPARPASVASRGTMFDHVKFGCSDYAASKAFFLRALAPLGIVGGAEGDPAYGIEMYHPGGKVSLCLFQADEKPAHLHIAFVAATRLQVDAFHRAALAAGGVDHGAPGLRPNYHAHYYAAFVIGPDGHNIEAVCHAPEAESP